MAGRRLLPSLNVMFGRLSGLSASQPARTIADFLGPPHPGLSTSVSDASSPTQPQQTTTTTTTAVSPDEIVDIISASSPVKGASDPSKEFVAVKYCPTCPPHKDRADNLYTLNVHKTTGSFNCFRCQETGNAADLLRNLDHHDLAFNPSTQSSDLDDNHELASVSQSSRPRRPHPRDAQRYQANLSEPQFARVRQYLTERRGLDMDVLRLYSVGAVHHSYDGEEHSCVTFPWVRNSDTTADGQETVRIKTRSVTAKHVQRILPAGGESGFFGWHTVPASAKRIVVTEGEFDAMAVHQATGLAAISLPNGANSLPDALTDALARFDTVVLWCDADQAGQGAARKLASKLGHERTVSVQAWADFPGDFPKDANQALLNGDDLTEMVDRAAPLPHENILGFGSLRADILYELQNAEKLKGVPLRSFPALTSVLGGLRMGEMTVLTGPTGSGKTTLLSQISLDCCRHSDVRTMWGSFEIRNVRLARMMLTQFAGKRLEKHIDEFDAICDRFQRLPLFFLDFFGSTSIDQVLEAMNYAVDVYKVDHFVLDNLQFMLGCQGKGYDKFDLQDQAIEKFRVFASQHNVHVTLVCHPKKEPDGTKLGLSSVFGGGKAVQEADNVLVIQNEFRKDKPRYIDVKKNRYTGLTGTVPVDFDREALCYREIESLPDDDYEHGGFVVQAPSSSDMRRTPSPSPSDMDEEIIMG